MAKTNDAYLSNPNLKRANVPILYTPDQIKEFAKCKSDPVYFIENYIKIVHVDLGEVNFILRQYQKDIVSTIVANRFVICKMSRQSGKSTTVMACMLWYILFHENYNIAVLANKGAQAREILARLQFAYEFLPKWLQQGVVVWNKSNIELENGSKVLAAGTSSSAVRGGTFNLIYLDEYAHVLPHIQEQFFTSVYPTISSGETTKVLITSTPNGIEGFHKIWMDSVNNKNKYVRVDVPWHKVPGRDEKWKRETIANTSERQFKQEFECLFVGSLDTLIDPNKLANMVSTPPLQDDNFSAMFSRPRAGRFYIATVDCSRGVGRDYSTILVYDVTEHPYQVVYRYRNNKIATLLFPTVIAEVCKLYNKAYVLIELNDCGQEVANILHQDLEYENIFFSTSKQKAGQTVTAFAGQGALPGIKTTKTVKRVGCSILKNIIETDKLITHDIEIHRELTTFVYENDSFGAQDGSHDDLVMAMVTFAWLTSQPYFKELTNSDLRQHMLNTAGVEEDNLAFMLFDDGSVDFFDDEFDAFLRS